MQPVVPEASLPWRSQDSNKQPLSLSLSLQCSRDLWWERLLAYWPLVSGEHPFSKWDRGVLLELEMRPCPQTPPTALMQTCVVSTLHASTKHVPACSHACMHLAVLSLLYVRHNSAMYVPTHTHTLTHSHLTLSSAFCMPCASPSSSAPTLSVKASSFIQDSAFLTVEWACFFPFRRVPRCIVTGRSYSLDLKRVMMQKTCSCTCLGRIYHSQSY